MSGFNGIANPTILLNSRNYVVWESEILKQLKSSSALHAEISGKNTFSDIRDKELADEKDIAQTEYATVKLELEEDKKQFGALKEEYRIEQDDFDAFDTITDEEIFNLVGLKGLQKYRKNNGDSKNNRKNNNNNNNNKKKRNNFKTNSAAVKIDEDEEDIEFVSSPTIMLLVL